MAKSLMSKVANALSFAHLSAGVGRPAAAAEDDPDKKPDDKSAEDEDDPKKKRDDESAEEYAARMEAEPKDEDDPDDKKAAAAPVAPSAEAITAAKAEGHAAGLAAGRTAERERCAVIFAAPSAARNVALAAELAFGTDMASDRVVAVLDKAPTAALHRPERASKNPNVGVGASADATAPQAIAKGWDAAFAKVNTQFKR